MKAKSHILCEIIEKSESFFRECGNVGSKTESQRCEHGLRNSKIEFQSSGGGFLTSQIKSQSGGSGFLTSQIHLQSSMGGFVLSKTIINWLSDLFIPMEIGGYKRNVIARGEATKQSNSSFALHLSTSHQRTVNNKITGGLNADLSIAGE